MTKIICMSRDTSMLHPWGVGDFAVGIGFPGETVTVLECVGVDMKFTDEESTVNYSLQIWHKDPDPPLGWELLKDGDGK